jgi:uncharacterized protein YcsI (UPF0317 family)
MKDLIGCIFSFKSKLFQNKMKQRTLQRLRKMDTSHLELIKIRSRIREKPSRRMIDSKAATLMIKIIKKLKTCGEW